MAGLIMAAQLILGLAILVTLHELGHFLAARAFGIRVEKFYLFFDAWGFKFFSFRRGETEYGIGWLPLGGYVKISGMIDESMDKEAMKQPAQSWEFRSKPAWQRLIVMIAGVTMNVILGIAIYTMVLMNFDKQYLSNEANKAIAAAKALLKEYGDEYISLELMLLGLAKGNDKTGRLLREQGATFDALAAAVKELRKGRKVTDQTTEHV